MLGVDQVVPETSRERARRAIADALPRRWSASATRSHKRPARAVARACASASASRAPSRSRPEDAAARRAVRHARLAHAARAAGRAARALAREREDGADGDPRRGRGAVPVRPRRDDDQRPAAPRSATSSTCRSRGRASAPRCSSTPTTTRCASELIGFLGAAGRRPPEEATSALVQSARARSWHERVEDDAAGGDDAGGPSRGCADAGASCALPVAHAVSVTGCVARADTGASGREGRALRRRDVQRLQQQRRRQQPGRAAVGGGRAG